MFLVTESIGAAEVKLTGANRRGDDDTFRLHFIGLTPRRATWFEEERSRGYRQCGEVVEDARIGTQKEAL